MTDANSKASENYREQREVLRQVPIEGLWGELIRRCIAGEYPEGWPKGTLNQILDLPENLSAR